MMASLPSRRRRAATICGSSQAVSRTCIGPRVRLSSSMMVLALVHQFRALGLEGPTLRFYRLACLRLIAFQNTPSPSRRA